MKWVIAVLWISSASGLLGGLTNIQRWSSSHGAIYYASVFERMLVLAIGILCAIAAYACAQKKKMGWWLVTVFGVALVCVTGWGAVRRVADDLFLAFWWVVQIVLMFFFLRWWFRQSKLFSTYEEKA